MSDDNGYIFRGGYIEDPAGDRWWSADLLKRVETERDELRSRLAHAEADAEQAVYHAEIHGAQKALDAVVKMLESCNDRIVPIGWDKSAWETFCLHRYGAADDVRAMKPEDILK